MIDVDDFKHYNDTLGHSAGEAILREMRQVIRNIVRKMDFAARYGGDEFAVVLPYAGRDTAKIVAERIHIALTSRDFLHDRSIMLGNPTVSMAAAVFLEEARTKENLLKKADTLLYQAEQRSKNRYRFSGQDVFSELDN
jgi:two-component system cell cycle response regulator